MLAHHPKPVIEDDVREEANSMRFTGDDEFTHATQDTHHGRLPWPRERDTGRGYTRKSRKRFMPEEEEARIIPMDIAPLSSSFESMSLGDRRLSGHWRAPDFVSEGPTPTYQYDSGVESIGSTSDVPYDGYRGGYIGGSSTSFLTTQHEGGSASRYRELVDSFFSYSTPIRISISTPPPSVVSLDGPFVGPSTGPMP